MAEPTCHYCDRAAEEQCPTCGRLYCLEHGDDVCLRCMSPEAAAPSATMYRGSLLVLVVASLVAVFLFVRPPASKSAADTVHTLATSTSITSATATPTPPGTRPATAVGAATTGGTPVPTTGTAVTTKQYTVKSGDTLSGIAAANNTSVEAIEALNPGLTAQTLGIGTVLNMP